MVQLLLIVPIVIFSIQAIRSRALISSALWLAGVSALLALTLYQLGAHLLAVIELSVGTGLVTILFVLAINIAGDVPVNTRPVLPVWLTVGMSLVFFMVSGWLLLSAIPVHIIAPGGAGWIAEIDWQERSLDLLVQVIIIYSGVLGFLGLLAEVRAPLDGSVAASFIMRRDKDLKDLEELGLNPAGDLK